MTGDFSKDQLNAMARSSREHPYITTTERDAEIGERAYQRGFTAGAESMRERTAQTVERLTHNPDGNIYYRASLVLERIRALPTEVK